MSDNEQQLPDPGNSSAEHEILTLLGVTRHSVRVDGYLMSYVTGGSGPPVVLLHGLGTNAITWRRMLPALLPHYTVYALDMLGCGASDKPDIDYSVSTMAHYVARFMESAGIAHAHFIGHSFGGGVTLHLYGQHPEYIDRVVLIASGGLGKAVHWLLRASTLPGADQVIGALSGPRSPLGPASRAMEERRLRRLQSTDPIPVPTMFDRLQVPETRQAFLRMIRNASTLQGQKMSALPTLTHFDRDVLILWGKQDRTIPVAHGMAAAALMPRAHLVQIDRCYHRPQIEAYERCNSEIVDFLQAHQWPPPPFFSAEPVMGPIIPRLPIQPAHLRRIAPAALFVVGTTSVLLRARARRRRNHLTFLQ